MLIQIEITNACNYKCFYCSGRNMDQEHMTMEKFMEIVEILPKGDHTIRLLGEGEPTLNPNFWEMSKIIFDLGYKLDNIINGTIVDADLFNKYYNNIIVSIDTLDPAESNRIGRVNLPKVLKNLDLLIVKMGNNRVTVQSANYGQNMRDLIFYCKKRKIRHTWQFLQRKEDYRINYQHIEFPVKKYTYKCKYLINDLRRNYDKHDNVMPCCFIKDKTKFKSIEAINQMMDEKRVPPCCVGCREILE